MPRSKSRSVGKFVELLDIIKLLSQRVGDLEMELTTARDRIKDLETSLQIPDLERSVSRVDLGEK
jgi:hypothetical protein